MLGVNSIVIDIEEAKKLVEIMELDRGFNKQFYQKLSERGLLEALTNFRSEVKNLDNIQGRIYSIDTEGN